MITLDTLKTRLDTTGYTVQFARDREVDLQELTDLPIIYIGYNNIDNKNPNQPIAYDTYDLNGENLVQNFTIQLVCQQAEFSTIWKAVYKKLIGWNPVVANSIHTSFTYVQGGVMGLSNSKFYWVDIWRIGFPTTSIL
jgi:hypothetical protein